MALNKTAFKQGLKGLLEAQALNENDPAQAREDFAEELATLVIDLIKTATVSGTVVTTGSATTQTGPFTQTRIL